MSNLPALHNSSRAREQAHTLTHTVTFVSCTHTHTCPDRCMHTLTLSYTYVCAMCTHSYIHICSHTYLHTHMFTQIHTPLIQAPTHTHTYAYTFTYMLICTHTHTRGEGSQGIQLLAVDSRREPTSQTSCPGLRQRHREKYSLVGLFPILFLYCMPSGCHPCSRH